MKALPNGCQFNNVPLLWCSSVLSICLSFFERTVFFDISVRCLVDFRLLVYSISVFIHAAGREFLLYIFRVQWFPRSSNSMHVSY